MNIKKLSLYIIIGILMSLLMIEMVSAWFPSQKINPTPNLKIGLPISDSANIYPAISIRDWFGLGGTEADLVLTEHTAICDENCISQFQITTYQDSALIDEVNFYTIQEDGSETLQPIRNYHFEILNGTKQIWIDDQKLCTRDSDLSNENCIITEPAHYEEVDNWINYTNEILSADTYQIRLFGNKRADREVDWKIKTQGVEVSDWSIWGPATGGYANNPVGIATTNVENLASDATRGLRIIANKNTSIVNITFDTAATGDNCTIWNNLVTITAPMASATIGANHICSFNPFIVNITENISYVITMHNTAGNYDSRYKSISPFPIANPDLNYTNAASGSIGGAWNAFTTTEIDDIVNITTFSSISGGSMVTINSPIDNYNSISTINFNCSAIVVGATLTNISLYDNSSGWKIAQTNTLTGTTNSTIFTRNYPNGNYIWTCLGCDSDGACGMATTNRTFSISDIIENSRTYNSITTSGSTETFNVNITYNNTFYSGITGYLVYNNTQYILNPIAGSTSNIVYSRAIPVPGIASSVNKSFYFNFLLSNSSSVTNVNLSTSNQTIIPFFVDNCTNFSKKIFSYRIIDEETLINLTGTINILVNIYSLDRNSLITTFNGTLNYDGINPVSVCVANLTSAYSTDYAAQFWSGALQNSISSQSYYNTTTNTTQTINVGYGYFVKYKNIQNFTLTNLTNGQNYTLYDLFSTSGNVFQIQVRGSLLNMGILVDVQKQYLSQNQFNSVESYVTDSDGNAVAHLTQASALYNFLLSKNGQLLATFNNYQVKCANAGAGDCTIILNIGAATTTQQNYAVFGNITGVFLLNQNTSTLFFTYSSDPELHLVRVVVFKDDGFQNETICDASTYAASGTLICIVPPTYADEPFLANVYDDGVYMGTSHFIIGEAPNYYGINIILELLMYSSLVLLMMSSPILIIIGSVIGMFMAFLLIMISGNTLWNIIGAMIWFVAAAIMIIIHMRRTYAG